MTQIQVYINVRLDMPHALLSEFKLWHEYASSKIWKTPSPRDTLFVVGNWDYADLVYVSTQAREWQKKGNV
jgi:hypothetical protein